MDYYFVQYSSPCMEVPTISNADFVDPMCLDDVVGFNPVKNRLSFQVLQVLLLTVREVFARSLPVKATPSSSANDADNNQVHVISGIIRTDTETTLLRHSPLLSGKPRKTREREAALNNFNLCVYLHDQRII